VVEDPGGKHDIEAVGVAGQFVFDVGLHELDAIETEQIACHLATPHADRSGFDAYHPFRTEAPEFEGESAFETAEINHGAPGERAAARLDDRVGPHIRGGVDTSFGGVQPAAEMNPMRGERQQFPPWSVSRGRRRCGLGRSGRRHR
jgi:hypothetical protein